MKSVFLSSTFLLSAILSQPAFAQDADSAIVEDQSLAEGSGEIVVTARRREETLQSIPASVVAVTQESLQRASATDLSDIARLTPGLSFNSGNAGGLGAPTLRGVTNVTTTTFDNNVGVFLDGVYLSAKSNLDIDLFNLSRTEVIKGPQSALYGNNAFAGAINYVLARPTETFSGQVRASVGTDDLYEIAGRVSIPLTSTLRAQVVGSYSHFGGTVDNLNGENLGGWDKKWSASGMLEWTPGTAFSASLFYYHYEDELDGGANYIFTNNCGGTTVTTPNRGGSNRRYKCGILEAPDQVNVDPASYSQRSSDIAIGRLAYDFGPVALRYTGSYGKYDAVALQDQQLNTLGGTVPTASRRFTQPFVGPVKEWSQELRLESYGNSFFDWAVGGYYYDREATQRTIVGLGTAQTAKSLNNLNVENTTMKSAFALGTIKITPSLDIEAQGRWTWEDKNSVLTNNLTGAVLRPAADFSYGTYRVTGNWRFAENKSLYAVVASGTKSGGFNNTAVVSEQAFGPEKNTTFEIGSKNQFLNGRVTINASAYYIDWTDLQLSVPSAIAGQTNPVTNIGSASVKGFDVSFGLRPTRNLDLMVSYSYTDPKWNDGTIDYSSSRQCPTAAACGLTQVGTGIDIGGFQIPRTSQNQYVGAATWTIPLRNSELYIRGDVSYRSEQSASAIALQYTDEQVLVNSRIGWSIGKYELSLFVKNLFNKQYIVSSITEPEFVPSTTFTTGFVGNGRIFGLTAEAKF
ncbi:TonB-dependent receptor [Sphingomonas sp. HF-S4]|uniref:TonB-dependent receptor n=1 Tax=Sphingomonas agrestis TaxID=3080540 RepID=A0ABU3Y3X3_9SPHN|nr:TonB-dependent receptor [Sphingomonas sp. HF-S4]MDV3456096.1 TonB-dependent receptor [Sphingomonas sp. HF-S4]